MSKVVYIGLEGSGKTALMSRDSYELVHRNNAWKKKTGHVRPIVSNIKYSPKFEGFARHMGVPVKYWKDLEELPQLTECDLFIDELGAYFDSRTFSDLPLRVRLWLAQADKLGVHIYGGCQDWGQVDVSYRRLVKHIFDIKKVVGTRRPSKSRPGAKHPWALIFSYKVRPIVRESVELKTLSIIPALYIFTRKTFERFDTNARVEDSSPPPLQRIVRHWFDEEGNIGYTRTVYR